MDIFSNLNVNRVSGENVKKNSGGRKFSNLAPLNKDTVSFGSGIKTDNTENLNTAAVQQDKTIQTAKSFEPSNILPEGRAISVWEKLKSGQEITPEEIETYRSEIKQKTEDIYKDNENKDQINDFISTYILPEPDDTYSEPDTPERLLLWDVIFSDERLYKDPEILQFLSFSKFNDVDSVKNLEFKLELINKYLNDKRFHTGSVMEKAGSIVLVSDTREEADVKSGMIDKYLVDKHLSDDEYFMRYFGRILIGTKTAEQAEFVDKVINNKDLYSNYNIMSALGGFSAYTDTKERTEIVNKVLNNEQLRSNSDLMNQLGHVLYTADTPEKAAAILGLIDKISGEAQLIGNEQVAKNLGSILGAVDTPEKAAVANKVLSEECFINCPDLIDYLDSILRNNVNSPEKAEEICKILDKVSSNEVLYDNEDLMYYLHYILGNVDSKEQSENLNLLIDKILGNEKLYNNTSLKRNMGTILDYSCRPEEFTITDKIFSDEHLQPVIYILKRILVNIDSPEQAAQICALLDKISGNEKLYNSTLVMSNIGEILYQANTPEKRALTDKVLSNEKLYSSPKVMNNLNNVLYRSSTPEQTEFIDKIFSNELLYNNDNIIEHLENYLNKTALAECTKARISIIDKILSDERLYGNENISDYMHEIIDETNSAESFEAKCAVIDKIMSDEKLYGNSNITEQLGYIISKSQTHEQAKIKCGIIDKILNDEKLYNNPNVTRNIGSIIKCANTQDSAAIADKVLGNEYFCNNDNLMNKLGPILYESWIPLRADVVNKILSDERLYGNELILNNIYNFIQYIYTDDKAAILDKVLSNEKLCQSESLINNLGKFISNIDNEEQHAFADKILRDERLYGNKDLMSVMDHILFYCMRTPEKAEQVNAIVDKILGNEYLYGNEKLMEQLGSILFGAETGIAKNSVIDKILSSRHLYANECIINTLGDILCSLGTLEQAQAKISVIDKLLSNERLYNNENIMNNLSLILNGINTKEDAEIKNSIADRVLSDEHLYGSENVMNNLHRIFIFADSPETAKITDKILSNEHLYNNANVMDNIALILKNANEEQSILSIIEEVFNDEKLYNDSAFMGVLGDILQCTTQNNYSEVMDLCKNFNKYEISPNAIPAIVKHPDEISFKDLQKLNRILGRENVSNLTSDDLYIACSFVDICKKNNINEISSGDKKTLLRKLVSSNTGLFKISDEMKKYFPLIPTSREEYCSLLPSIVRSLGIETNTLTLEQTAKYNAVQTELANTIADISDTDFANLHITQEYPKDDFIRTTLDKVKELTPAERQKVYDYFGFELHHNKNNKTGFSITGYPVNLNNGKKLAQITDPKTKTVVEDLRPDVIKFSENNHINCENPRLEKLLNETADALPEIRTMIGKSQHGTHEYDLMQHSLKVMQKIVQNPEFKKLNASDQKIMLLASLLHDLTKAEGYSDKTHANESSFDAFFIAKKFGLSKNEEFKLYTLIKNHEWLGYVNTARYKDKSKENYGQINPDRLTQRLQSVAYDLRQDNLFNMALMFAHADLKAVKKDDSFHDSTSGSLRTDINNSPASYGELADSYAQKIKGYVEELKKSQPILPVTKFPAASTVDKAITAVNPDGSTNIKGVYKDSDGLIIIKFNEVEDWEAIGFPNGSTSCGISVKGINNRGEETNTETGNIKFFAHGLDCANQLSKFDAFSLADSEVLLSVSYAERPESKFRFFRPQGIILDIDTENVHGGGNTDSGSGCGKFIKDFKEYYIFGGPRESDRVYISDLIKDATGMTDEQYVDFVEKNKNKQMTEIEPEELRTKIIQAFATINSNVRKGNREYNEMYVSNPKVMGVFAYNTDYGEKIGNPVAFLSRTTTGKHEKGYNGKGMQSAYERTAFLREYAIEHNLPFVVFGD